MWAWLAIFALPFLATLAYSLRTPDGVWTISAYQYVFGSFKENLLLSLETTVITIIINLVIAVPAAYAIVRYPLPGKSFTLSALNLSLYTPAAVMGCKPGHRLCLSVPYSPDDDRVDRCLRRGHVSLDARAGNRSSA